MPSVLPTINLKKNDKLTAAIVGLIGLAIFTFIGVNVLPYLIAAAANTAYFLLELAGLAIITMPIWDTNTRLATIYAFKNFSRNICRTVTRSNPIGVLTTAINRFEAKLNDIDTKMREADAAKKRHLKAMQDINAKRENEESLIVTAQRQSKSQTIIDMHASAAGRWQKAYDSMEPMLGMLNEMHENMIKAREVCDYRLQDLQNQREVLSVQYDTMIASQKAAKSFKAFFGANPDLAMLEMSVDEAERQISEAEAEIDQVLRIMTPAIESAQLQKSADAQTVLSKMKESKLLNASVVEGVIVEPIKQLVGR